MKTINANQAFRKFLRTECRNSKDIGLRRQLDLERHSKVCQKVSLLAPLDLVDRILLDERLYFELDRTQL